jgi:hypothetical protein
MWLRDRLVMREGPRYLSLATDFSQRVRLPIERIAAFMRESTVPRPAVASSSESATRVESKGGGRERPESCTV